MSDISLVMLAKHLREHNRWRRGEGKYEKAGVNSPITARQLGVVIDGASREIEKLADFQEWLDEEIASAEDETAGGDSYGDGYDKGVLIGLLTVRSYFTREEVL